MKRSMFDLILLEVVLVFGSLAAVRAWAGKEIVTGRSRTMRDIALVSRGVTG